MTAKAITIEANTNIEIVLSRLLLLLSQGLGLGFFVGVGVGNTWLLVSVLSVWCGEMITEKESTKRKKTLTHYNFQCRSGCFVILFQLCGANKLYV